MNQSARRQILIRSLLNERAEYQKIEIPHSSSDLMEKQGHEEPTGTAKITPAFNLPCEYVIHTVGPIVRGN